ncbi:type II toxin-antitoxin system RelE/ParE family toxin [soil metagenome]
MSFRITVGPTAEKSLRKRIAPQHAERLRQAISQLSVDPYPHNSLKFQGRVGHRLRVGDYRVIYEVDEDRRLISILQAGHRKDVYR